MPARPLSEAEKTRTLQALATARGDFHAAAVELGIRTNSLRDRVKAMNRRPAQEPPPAFEYQALPSERVTVEDLLERRKAQFQQKQAHEQARKLLRVKVNVPGPIGILHFGDPHVDDDGTDIAALERHAALVRKTKGLFGANVGDTTNNWCGRLARL